MFSILGCLKGKTIAFPDKHINAFVARELDGKPLSALFFGYFSNWPTALLI